MLTLIMLINVLKQRVEKCTLIRKLTTCRQQSSEPKSFSSIPGPKYYPIVGNLFSLKKYGGDLDLVFPNLLFELHRRYGNIVKFGIAKKAELYVFDPESIEKVFMLNDKDPGKKKLEPWILYLKQLNRPQSLSNSEGPRWRKLRNSINPILSMPQGTNKHLIGQNKIADGMVESIISEMGGKDSIIYEHFEKNIRFYALEDISHASFGKRIVAFDEKLRPKETDEFVESLDKFCFLMSSLMSSVPLWKYISTKKWREFKSTTDKMLNFIDKFIDDAFENLETSENNSIVKYLYDNKEKYDITNGDIQSMVTELFTSGLDTVATTMHFILYKLASNKEFRDELYSEVNGLVRPGQIIDEEILSQMKFLKAFVNEVLRYYPIVCAVGRFVREDMVLHGYKVPKGTFVNVISGVTSHLESVYDNPSKFDPHRWLDNTKNYHQFGMLPFGYGNRICVAKRFGENEMYMALIKIIQNFDIEYVGEEFGYINAMFSGPDKPLRLKFIKRNN